MLTLIILAYILFSNISEEKTYAIGSGCSHLGTFDYKVVLKPNLLYGQIIMDSGKKYFTNIIDYLDSKYTYNLECNEGISGKYNLKAIARTGQWEKSFVLIDDTNISSENNEKKFSLTIGQQINLSSYVSLIDDINKELGINDEQTAELMLNYSFSTQERFEHSIRIPLNSKTMEINGSLTKNKKDMIQKTIRKGINYYSAIPLSMLMLGIVLITGFVSKIKIKQKVESGIQNILDQYKDIIVEGIMMTSENGNVMVQRVKSVNDLIKIADDLIKPVIHIQDNDRNILYVLDTSIKYEYIVENNG